MVDEFEIIDAHFHLQRNLAVEKRDCPVPGRRDRDRLGNPEAIYAYLDHAGISKVLCLVPAPTAELNKLVASRMQFAAASKKSPEPAKDQFERDILAQL